MNERIRKIGIVSAGLGILLVVVSLFWTSFADGRSVWSVEKAERKQQLYREIKKLTYHVRRLHRGPETDEATLVESRQRLDALQKEAQELGQDLQDARESPNHFASGLKWMGGLFVLIGITGILGTRLQN